MWNINAAGMFGFEDILWNVCVWHKPSHTSTLRVTTLIPIAFSRKTLSILFKIQLSREMLRNGKSTFGSKK